MNYAIMQNTAFPMVEITLDRGEEVQIESGSMVYHDGNVTLEGKMNTGNEGGGVLGGFLKAAARSVVSGESFFITRAKGMQDKAKIAIAPDVPGAIRKLQVAPQQWRINDGAFLACDASVSYEMKRQSLGKAIFGGTGGLFVMETKGTGIMLINCYGDCQELQVNGTLVVDNTHVVAWSTTLDYEIKVASGTFGFTTGEGLVNEFKGTGAVLIQTRNMKSFVDRILPFLPKGK